MNPTAQLLPSLIHFKGADPGLKGARGRSCGHFLGKAVPLWDCPGGKKSAWVLSIEMECHRRISEMDMYSSCNSNAYKHKCIHVTDSRRKERTWFLCQLQYGISGQQITEFYIIHMLMYLPLKRYNPNKSFSTKGGTQRDRDIMLLAWGLYCVIYYCNVEVPFSLDSYYKMFCCSGCKMFCFTNGCARKVLTLSFSLGGDRWKDISF